MSTRIYLVTNTQTNEESLISATNPAPAIRHAAKKTFTARVAKQDDLVRLLPTTMVEKAGEEAEEADPA